MKIIQIGEGNFLRTFVDAYFDCLNKENLGNYEVTIVKPITFGNFEKFNKQNNKYHIVLRGMKNGKAVEDIYKIDSVKATVDPFNDLEAFYSLATDEEVKILVSNTTEAGICYREEDKFGEFETVTYPAKLTQFLYKRYKAGLPGIYMLPVELIENNADELNRCVNKYIDLWALGAEFKKWINECNFFCNTLVDRIVSGFPRVEETRNHLYELIGETDELVSIGEPFGLWAVEDKGDIKSLIHEGHHNIDVVLTKNIGYYKKRKVRVLNGSHTNLVPISLWMGKETVYDVMTDKKLFKFVENTLTYDIIPFVSDDIKATTEFANDVKERFFNPFLNHQLTSIALNSISKWKARDLPSFVDYYKKHGEIPTYLTIGFAYLANMYQNIRKDGDKYYVDLPSRTIEVKDDLNCLEYFMSGRTIEDFLKDKSLWGMDLTSFNGMEERVCSLLLDIASGKDAL